MCSNDVIEYERETALKHVFSLDINDFNSIFQEKKSATVFHQSNNERIVSVENKHILLNRIIMIFNVVRKVFLIFNSR